jgi:hypothetical protein
MPAIVEAVAPLSARHIRERADVVVASSDRWKNMTDAPNEQAETTAAEASARQRRSVIGAGAIIVAAVAVMAVYAWLTLGDEAMSASGYVALALGIVGTVGLGVGLMALVFFSHRYGYDERSGGSERE